MSFETEIVEALSKGDPQVRLRKATQVCVDYGLMGPVPEPIIGPPPEPEVSEPEPERVGVGLVE